MLVPHRRAFLTGAMSSLVAAPLTPAFAAIDKSGARSLAFNNIHTGERLAVDYWIDGSYQPEALAEVNHVLRDFRTGDVHPIDPRLLDLLARLRTRLETMTPIQVISGFRSPATNAMLRGESEHSGVASKSLHMQGMAIDIRMEGRALKTLQQAALAEQAGGVGYYPQPDFVHVDVGRVRRW
jgi:uncharacterized protein YcbK (DUF882 family)